MSRSVACGVKVREGERVGVHTLMPPASTPGYREILGIRSPRQGRLAGVLRDLVAAAYPSRAGTSDAHAGRWPRSGATLPAAAWRCPGPLRSQSDGSHPKPSWPVGAHPAALHLRASPAPSCESGTPMAHDKLPAVARAPRHRRTISTRSPPSDLAPSGPATPRNASTGRYDRGHLLTASIILPSSGRPRRTTRRMDRRTALPGPRGHPSPSS